MASSPWGLARVTVCFRSSNLAVGALVRRLILIRQVPLPHVFFFLRRRRGVGFFTARLGGATARAQTEQYVAPATGLLVHIGDGLRSP